MASQRERRATSLALLPRRTVPSPAPPRTRRDGAAAAGGASSSHPPHPYHPQASQADEEEEVAASQGAHISREELEALVSDMVRYMLFKNHQHPGVPVKREELAQLGCKNYKNRFLLGQVINECQRKLLAVFGIEMKEVVRVRQPTIIRGRATTQAVTEVKTYILRSTLPEELRMKYVDSPKASVLSGLVLVVIGIIQLAGDNISEANLWAHLQRLGVNEHDDRHPIIGNVKQAMETIIKQRYIQKERSENEGFTFKLAERALDADVKTKLTAFVSKITKSEASGGAASYVDV